MQARLSKYRPRFTWWKYICNAIDGEKSGCAFPCISEVLVTLSILLVSGIFLTKS